MDQPHWYALRTKSRHEKVAEEYLRGLGVEVFLPLYKSRRLWSDRVKFVDLPLFDGYLFGRFAAGHALVVRSAPGVLYVVSSGDVPAPVPESEIDAVRRVLEKGLVASPTPYLREGMRVRIRGAAFEGVEGRLEKVKSQFRLVLSIHLLQRSVALEVDPEMVEALN
jgi:transcription antitermination factor NusG